MNNSVKIKSSAILIALFVGTILMAILSIAALEGQKMVSSIISNSDMTLAEIAAESGLEQGRFLYEKEISAGKNYYSKAPVLVSLPSVGRKSESFDYQIKMQALTVGKDFSASDWLSDAKKAQMQNALLVNNADEFIIDLDYLFHFAPQKERPTSLIVTFSNPFKVKGNEFLVISDNNAKINLSWELIDQVSGQKITSGSQNSVNNHKMQVNGMENCSASKKCLLKIKELSSPKEAVGFIKIEAKSANGLLPYTGDRPGTIIIESNGKYGLAKKKLQAKYESLGGKFLGIYSPR